MFLANSTRVRPLLTRIPRGALTTNQGALYIATSRTMSSNDIGSGSGKGGGSGGSIRESGGAMGRKGAAQEEHYFSKQNSQLKDKLKDHLKDELKKHEEAIKSTKKLLDEVDKAK